MIFDELKMQVATAITKFGMDFAVLADAHTGRIELVNPETLHDYLWLFNSHFYDGATVRAVHENLQVSILPQIVRQGDKYGLISMLGDHIVVGLFGQGTETAMQRYRLSKEVGTFLQHCQVNLDA